MGMGNGVKDKLAKRAAMEVKEHMIVNLGIGIPSLVPNHLSPGFPVIFQSENGIIGIGPAPGKGCEDENLCNAGGFPVSLVKGGSYTDSSIAFAMIRRGKVDLTILGSLQVSEKGDLANWIIPGKKVPGMGGATELASKAEKVIVLMTHLDKKGGSKIVRECTLPLTARACVSMIITDRAVFTIEDGRLILREIFNPYTLQDIEETTEASYFLSPAIKYID
ncbi:3-oxoacid CoA-transferase subunit B (plasmid) [Cytobacillus spongiae]|uniref:3-oxoacid CoA-transferase subunit B n=1 Tax=Cytobacillus spongiae TaxID=2901381 RepID=UPI00145DE196|nr:3-oxoacid CoA-transferase subunit B [Cytobacillus spongiae]NMH70401.1 3-oxoacid CoA-transferase subunit B [Bacillus sp. RO3]UII58658.1 3-oxoacid CoA-transferase subunit B [Cytobacillus spongiae]